MPDKMKNKKHQTRDQLEDLSNRQTADLLKEIRERKRIEKALNKSIEKYRSLASAKDPMYLVDKECRYQFVNDGQLARLGRSSGKVIGKRYGDFHSEVDAKQFAQDVKRALKTGESFQAEHKSQRDNRCFLRSFTPVADSQGNPNAITVVSKDITDLKQSEEKTRTLLRENEALLREIHHRVKNNMQIVSSLLNLQAAHFKNPDVVGALKENQRRIHAMALVHEKLYKSPNLEKIDFADYVTTVVTHLSQSLQINSGRIRIIYSLEPLFLSISSAIPCGLIISELISNCLKHAFPDGRKGTIKIEFRRKKDHETELELIVRDDGVGFPLGVDIDETGTLGLEILHLLTEQLNGSVKMERDNGTVFRICFEEPIYMPRI